MTLALKEPKESSRLSTAEHERIVKYVKSELRMGDLRSGSSRGHLPSSIEKAHAAAQALDPEERTEIALEGMETLIKIGYHADAQKVMSVFRIPRHKAETAVFNASVYLLNNDTPRNLANLERVLNAWEMFHMDIRNLGLKEQSLIKDAAEGPIEYASVFRPALVERARRILFGHQEARQGAY